MFQDAKIECLQCKHRMRVVVADGVPGDRTKEYVDYIRTFSPGYMSFQMKVLIYSCFQSLTHGPSITYETHPAEATKQTVQIITLTIIV